MPRVNPERLLPLAGSLIAQKQLPGGGEPDNGAIGAVLGLALGAAGLVFLSLPSGPPAVEVVEEVRVVDLEQLAAKSAPAKEVRLPRCGGRWADKGLTAAWGVWTLYWS